MDLALVDVRMPDLDGLELLRAIEAEWAELPVIMLSTYDNAPYVKRALADGASGYLLKDATPEDLAQAINVAHVRQRQRAVAARDPEPLRGARGLRQREHGQRPYPPASTTSRNASTTSWRCSPRAGATATSRGQLYLSEKTVKAHLAAIFRKLGVTNRTQAAMMAVQMGVGPVPGALVPSRRG